MNSSGRASPLNRPRRPHQNFDDFSKSLENSENFLCSENTWIIPIAVLFLRSCGVKVLKFQLERLSGVGVWATRVDHHTDRRRLELHGTPLSALSLGLPAISRTYANLFHQATASSLLPPSQLPMVWSPRDSELVPLCELKGCCHSLTNCRSLFENPAETPGWHTLLLVLPSKLAVEPWPYLVVARRSWVTLALSVASQICLAKGNSIYSEPMAWILLLGALGLLTWIYVGVQSLSVVRKLTLVAPSPLVQILLK